MKSDARLGESEPTTSIPSTIVRSIVCVLMNLSLGERTDNPGVPRPDTVDDVNASSTPPARTRPPGTLRTGEVGGIDVLVRSSWLLVAVLIAFVLAPTIETIAPGLGALTYVAGVAFAVLLYLS